MKQLLFSIIIIILLILPVKLFSQFNNKSADVKIKGSTYMSVKGDFKNSGTIDNAGTIQVTGNFTNNSSITSEANSTVSLNGGAQQIGGASPTTFSNLVIDGTDNKQCNISASVAQSLTFNSNKILLGNNDLKLLQGATITGADNSKYVVTNGSGFLKARAVPTSTDFLFPVGNSATSYKPITLNYTGTVDTFRVRIIPGLTPTTGADNNCVQYTYQIEEMIQGGSNASLKLGWNTADEGTSFTRTNAIMWQNISSVWTPISGTPGAAASTTTDWSYQASGITDLSSTAGKFILDINKRTLHFSSVLLEGLYLGGGAMSQAKDETGNAHWNDGSADHIYIELHDQSNYSNIICTVNDIPLSTSGAAVVNVPVDYNGSYYITVRHRNSLETTTASPVSFSGSLINQAFGDPSNVYFGNLGSYGDGYYFIYGGDVNQDGWVDTGDYSPVDNDSYNGLQGYLYTDVNGDGWVDTGDYTIVDNNSYNGVQAFTP